MTTDPSPEERVAAPRQDNQDPALFGQTPSQTVGPFFHYGLPWRGGADLVGGSSMGARPDLFDERHYVLNLSAPTGTPAGDVMELRGRVLDGNGTPIVDAMVEIWQANAAGRYASRDDKRPEIAMDPHFVGFGRAAVDADGFYRFRTVKPGRVPGPAGTMQAPHFAMSILGRGLLKRLATRMYLPDGDGLADDPVLAAVPAHRRDTLLAVMEGDDRLRFDVVLSGDGETVFFDL